MLVEKPYFYLCYRWWKPIDFGVVFNELIGFSVEHRPLPVPLPLFDYSFISENRDGYKVTADTLSAFLHPLKAMLFQREPAAFTKRDLKLREVVLKHYTMKRENPVTPTYKKEPKFSIVE
ncbi:hypothetical protein FJY84_07100 [Candidatus Bathyarchaeota archaeon]|nr:hypothetical protein [Candidatus Bathyarchaeota archaeon]